MDLSSDYNNLSSKELDEEPESKGTCDFCQTAITEDEEERRVGEIILCESCGSHYLD